MIDIVLVGPGDAEILGNVDPDVFDHPIQPSLVAEFLASPSNVLVVAREDGQVVGMASGLTYVHPDKPRSLFLNEVGVASRLQGQGIGKKLVHRILEWGREQGCTEAWVATEVGNLPARRLYESTGGTPDDDHAVVYTFPLGHARDQG